MRHQVTTTREQNRIDTMRRIVEASRRLVTGTGEMTLRAVANEVGMTAPALYRYVDSHEELVRIVAMDIDASAAAQIAVARDAQPEDDPAARLVAAAVAFRQWALGNREEFSLVFTNLDVSCIEELQTRVEDGPALLGAAVRGVGALPVPAAAARRPRPRPRRDPARPAVPADLTGVPDELRPLIWLLERAWARLYGTVTLEVFGHIDPRIVEKALLFRAMLEDQAAPLGTDRGAPAAAGAGDVAAGLTPAVRLRPRGSARGPSGCPRRP